MTGSFLSGLPQMKRLFVSARRFGTLALTAGCLLLCGFSEAPQGRERQVIRELSQPEIIYQAFNERFVDLQPKLESLRSQGFTTIQISPPQKSLPSSEWWGRYQPYDYRVIEGPLGNESELRDLMTEGHRVGLIMIVDVVLNHMADARRYNDLHYPQFAPWDFHFSETRPCIQNWGDRFQVTHHWFCDFRAQLPDLDTSSSYVRGVHKDYLRKLTGLGADGFRVDAAKHIEPEYFTDVLGVLSAEQRHWTIGEVIASNGHEAGEYSHLMRLTDFQLTGSMIKAFSLGGDLRSLINPASFGGALPEARHAAFARNHDTAMNAGFFQFAEYRDAMLANAYVLARRGGVPFIFNADADDSLVKAGMKFRIAVGDAPEYFRNGAEICEHGSASVGGVTESCDNANFLFIERGDFGLAVINKANAWIDVSAARMRGLSPGCYRELNYKFDMEVFTGSDGQKWISGWGSGNRGGLNIGPRSAMFFVKKSSDRCRF